MKPLAEMEVAMPFNLDGSASTTTEVWTFLSVSREGNFDLLQRMTDHKPALASCMYDYTTPLHMAIQRGHTELAGWLILHGGYSAGYRTHPFLVPFDTFAEDRGLDNFAQSIRKAKGNKQEHGGQIDYQQDEEQIRFQEAVDKNDCVLAQHMLSRRSDLATNPLAFWGEGILMMPAKEGHIPMMDLLLDFGDRVPDLSKWGARYYFERLDSARYLLKRGMNPNHANWRGFTLLHDMAFENDVEKARLLLEYGADIDTVDDDFSSTPLGYAAQFGSLEMTRFLLASNADPNAAGKPWARPLEWARKKGTYRNREHLNASRSALIREYSLGTASN